MIAAFPAAGIHLPNNEAKARVYLRVDDFQRLVAAAGGHPCDHCILTLFLQLGLRRLGRSKISGTLHGSAGTAHDVIGTALRHARTG